MEIVKPLLEIAPNFPTATKMLREVSDRFSFWNPLYLIFILCSLALFFLDPMTSGIASDFQLYFMIGALGLVGIPHGAIDHIIYMKENTIGTAQFYFRYVGLILLYVGLWVLVPSVSMAFFLVLSAFHFGQSQFSKERSDSKILNQTLQISWGVAILSAMVYFQSEAIFSLFGMDRPWIHIELVFNPNLYFFLMAISTVLTLAIFCKKFTSKSWTTKKFINELVILVAIYLCFWGLDLLIGFTLYFIILHSASVLNEEYQYLKSEVTDLTVRSFIFMTVPYTSVSILGSVGLYAAHIMGWLPIPFVMIVFVFVSALTLPHSLVMDEFYKKLVK